jgi:hypothetical protein
MNYTTITINGETIGLKFGMASFRYLENKFVEGKSFTGEQINEIGIANIIYSGYYNNCLIKDEQPKYSFEYFIDWIETNLNNIESINEITRIINFWSSNDFIKNQLPQEEPKKKSSRGKK